MQTISESKNNLSPSIFSPKGRIGRLSFLAGHIIILLIILILGFAIGFIGLSFNEGIIGYIVLGAIYIIFISFTYILTIKRLHDRNKSGWMALLSLIPIINAVFFIYLICAKGDKESNNYGCQRETPLVEKVLGWIYIAILPIFIGIFIITSIGAYQRYVEKAKFVQQQSIIHQNSP